MSAVRSGGPHARGALCVRRCSERPRLCGLRPPCPEGRRPRSKGGTRAQRRDVIARGRSAGPSVWPRAAGLTVPAFLSLPASARAQEPWSQLPRGHALGARVQAACADGMFQSVKRELPATVPHGPWTPRKPSCGSELWLPGPNREGQA